MELLKVGVIGYGVMGKNHVRVLQSLPNVQLVGVVDPLAESTPGFECISIEKLIQKGVDYCVIATPTSTHESLSLELFSHRVSALIEKPLAASYGSAMKILDSAQKNMVKVAVGHIERFNPALQEARRRIINGELGTIYQVATRRQGPYPARIGDVGVAMDLASHDIDLTRWLADSPYVRVFSEKSGRSLNEFEDMVVISGKLKNSVIVSHVVNWLSPLKERKVVITGEKGTFVVDTLRSDLTFYENGSYSVTQKELQHFKGITQGDITILAFDKPEPLVTEHLKFYELITKNNINESVSLNEASETVKVVEAILESASSGRVINL